MLFRLLQHLDRSCFSSQVISLTSVGPVGEDIQALGIPVRALGMRPDRLNPLALVRLIGWLRQDSASLVHTWLYHANLLGALFANLTGRPPVLWTILSSDMDMSHYSRISGWTLRACAWLSGWPKAVVVNSHVGRDFHSQIGYHPREWILIPNGIDLETFKPDSNTRNDVRMELGLDPETLLIGYVARFDPMKDHATFLRAARSLLDAESAAHFLLCGTGMTAENRVLVSQVESLRLEEHVHLLGNRDDIPKITAALDIASLTSISEGFPNVVAEAMACGIPCAVTDVGDVACVVGDTGRVVPKRDPVSMANAWMELSEMGVEGRQKLGTRARRRVQQHYSIGQMVERYREVYEQFARKRGE
jgi:glycosyltransferase involved in cell wall biosynthesis